jgi:hypothetical protein
MRNDTQEKGEKFRRGKETRFLEETWFLNGKSATQKETRFLEETWFLDGKNATQKETRFLEETWFLNDTNARRFTPSPRR